MFPFKSTLVVFENFGYTSVVLQDQTHRLRHRRRAITRARLHHTRLKYLRRASNHTSKTAIDLLGEWPFARLDHTFC